jgi:hypothetical protein
MSTPSRPGGRTPPPEPAEAVAAIAREVDRLRRKVEEADVPGLRAELGHLAVTVAGVAEQVAELADGGRGREKAAPSWLWPLEPVKAPEVLAGLVDWAGHVYVQYWDGRLPACWLWHPDVVEELVWLWHAWLAAYRSPAATPSRAADWHDRQRPGAARRITAATETCSLHAHLSPAPPPAVPTGDAAGAIGRWWAERDGAAPTPTAEQLAAADAVTTDRMTASLGGRW